MENEEVPGSKYAYLLQPIKDLERNFDINISALLEEYIAKLQEVAEAEDFRINNAHRFNFAEAAILIQGSANVLSRKVDLVYNTAMQFFEVMRATNEKKKKNRGEDEDEGYGAGDDANEDTILPNPVDPCNLQNLSKVRAANPLTLLNKSAPPVLPRIYIMPMSLMPLADYEKCNVPIFNPKNKNEVVGKKDDYKINTGYISKCGALLLDLKNEALTDNFRRPTEHEDSGNISENDENQPGVLTIALAPCSQMHSQQIEEPRFGMSAAARPSSLLMNDRRPTQLLTAVPESIYDNDGCGGFDDDDTVVPVTPPPPKKIKQPWEFDEKIEYDHTIELHDDPFLEAAKWKNKPYKEGKNCMNVNAIIGRRKKVEEKKESREKIMETIEFVNDQIYCMGKKQKKRRELGIGTQFKWEVDAILPYISAQQKLRDKRRREETAQKKAKERENRRSSGRTIPPLMEDDDDGFDGNGGFDDYDAPDPREQFVNADSLHREKIANVDDAELAGDINFPVVCIEAEPAARTRNNPFAPQESQDTGIHEGMTIEEIILYYRKKYWEQTAEAMSKLAARVQEWDEKMQPLLEEEETRKEFDIHEYGDELLAKFHKLSEERSLPALLTGKKKYEISRYFLSTLMLANCMNVEIVNEQQTGPDPLKMMNLKLLNRERHHKIFEEQGAL